MCFLHPEIDLEREGERDWVNERERWGDRQTDRQTDMDRQRDREKCKAYD